MKPPLVVSQSRPVLSPRRRAFTRAPSLHSPVLPPQREGCITSRVNPPRQTALVAPATPRRDPHADGGVWVMLVLLLLITVAALYLFWAKLATAWPFGL